MKYVCLTLVIVVTLALSRGGPSPWLLRLEVAGFMLAALTFGFSAWMPNPPGWLRYQEVRGMACFLVGAGSMFIDPRFVIASTFIGVGIRLIMTSPAMAAGPSEPKPTGNDIVLRDRAGMVIR